MTESKEIKTKRYYTVAVSDNNSWFPDGSPVIMYTCGHKHRSLKAATKCRKNLVGYDKTTKMWSAKWNGARILTYDHECLTNEENSIIEEVEMELDGYVRW